MFKKEIDLRVGALATRVDELAKACFEAERVAAREREMIIDYITSETKCPVCGENLSLEIKRKSFADMFDVFNRKDSSAVLKCKRCEFSAGGNSLKECIDNVKALGKGDAE